MHAVSAVQPGPGHRLHRTQDRTEKYFGARMSEQQSVVRAANTVDDQLMHYFSILIGKRSNVSDYFKNRIISNQHVYVFFSY